MRKLTFKYIKQLIEVEGYKLLTKENEYKNTTISILTIKCPEDHVSSMSWINWKMGSRCIMCSSRKRLTIDFIKQSFEQEGYDLITSIYINNHSKLEFKCPKGHISSMSWINWKKGARCGECFGSKKYTTENIKNYFTDNGYELLSEYKGAMKKVKLKCPKGHVYDVKPNTFKQGHRCPKCANRCPIQAKEQFIELLHQEGYELLSEYKGAMKKVKLKCPEGHIWYVTSSSFKNNYARCPHCEGSTGQRLLQKMLEEYNLGNVIYNDREVLNGLELDIYYPELSIGIEYQGNYWHTLSENIERDKRKRKLCDELNIKLIYVWDDDFIKNPDDITKLIHSKITGLMSR